MSSPKEKEDLWISSPDESASKTLVDNSLAALSSASLHHPPSQLHVRYLPYEVEKEDELLPIIRSLISKDLSEPYSIYVYRYFLLQWPELSFVALDENDQIIGAVISKLEQHRGGPLRGYIGMLAVREEHRGKGIASTLVKMAIEGMRARDADEVALETEITNTASLKLYERLGFLRAKRLHRYYLNGSTAFRLLLYLKQGSKKTESTLMD